MASCDHLCTIEEQLRELLIVVNDHELGYLLDQADEAESVNSPKEVGH